MSSEKKERKAVEELDSRFQTDFSFVPSKKNSQKLKLDKRFEPMFTSESFREKGFTFGTILVIFSITSLFFQQWSFHRRQVRKPGGGKQQGRLFQVLPAGREVRVARGEICTQISEQGAQREAGSLQEGQRGGTGELHELYRRELRRGGGAGGANQVREDGGSDEEVRSGQL